MGAKRRDYLTSGEAAEALGTSVKQLLRWERDGVMPPPSGRVQRGSRWDRAYTLEDVERMKELRSILRAGAPTAEEAAERERRRAQFLPQSGRAAAPTPVPAGGGRLGS